MADRRDEIRTQMLEGHRQLLDTVERLPAHAWDQPTPGNDGWTVKETLTHLCTIEERLRSQVHAIVNGTPYPSEDVNVFNARKLAERQGRTVAELRAELEAERAAALALLDGLSESDLDRSIEHPTRGQITAERPFRLISDHMGRHTREMAELLAR
jgi:uncharacterized damage-inducible protein DinB